MRLVITYFLVMAHLWTVAQPVSKSITKADKAALKYNYELVIRKMKAEYFKTGSAESFDLLEEALWNRREYSELREIYLKTPALCKSPECKFHMAETFLAFKDTVRALEAVRNTEDFLFNTIKNKVIFHRNTVHYLNQVVIESDVDMNTESNEICPVIIEGEVWYASDKAKSIVDNEEYGWTGQGYLSIYNQKGSVIQGLNSEYHDGPFSVTADGNTMYFSRAMYGKVDGKKQPIPLSIWQSVKQGKKWGTPIEVNLINNDENYSHPAISPKGDFMIFTATGTHETGKELMISYRNGGNWTKPENLGKTINTPFDEVFPVLANDSTLYFSSNGLPGFGGLDIFMVKLKNGKPYQQPRNVYGPINSGADDFHLVYLPEDPAKGYFTTNRSFEKGDDIFGFTIAKMIVGRIVTKRPDALQRTQFTVMQNGKEMATVKADPDGNLILPYLNSPYEVLVQQAAVDGDLSFTQISPEQGVHKFNLIRSDKSILNEISLTDDLHMTLVYGKKDDSSIEGSYVRGCFIEAEGKAKLNTAVIVDVHGNAIDTLPLVDGCITFRKLEGTHSILLPETTDDMELTFKAENVGKDNFKVPVLSATGKPLKFITVSNQSSFVISLKNIDQDKLKELIIENKVYKNVEGCVTGVNNKELIKEMKFALVDEKGNAIDTLYLNEKGCFFIKRLSPDHSLIPLADYDEGEIVFRNRTDEDLTDRKFYIRNKKLEIVDSVYLSKLNRLDMELTSIYQLEAEDVWLDFSLRDTTVIENIYFEYDDYKITLSARRTLNRVVQFLQKNPAVKLTISAHTDSRGNNEYNMILSQNRAKSTMDYLLSKGISKWKIKSAGYGESRLLNNCSDGAECTEEQHAKNRRIEFQIR